MFLTAKHQWVNLTIWSSSRCNITINLSFYTGNVTRVYGTVMQYAGSRSYTSSYYLQYSTDGDNFHNYTVAGQLTVFVVAI